MKRRIQKTERESMKLSNSTINTMRITEYACANAEKEKQPVYMLTCLFIYVYIYCLACNIRQ